MNAIMERNKEHQVYFSHNKPYNNLEHGMHLTRIVEEVGTYIDRLSSLKAMIDINFGRTTTYFTYTIVIYTFFCTIPFVSLTYITDDDWLLSILILSQFG